MCVTEATAMAVVIVGAVLAAMTVRALNMPAVDHKLDRNIYMMSDLRSEEESVLPITPLPSPE